MDPLQDLEMPLDTRPLVNRVLQVQWSSWVQERITYRRETSLARSTHEAVDIPGEVVVHLAIGVASVDQ
jgi:hypothetical protein